MNATFENENEKLRYAEYVLGVLDADARAAVAHEAQTSSEAATAVAVWERRLVSLVDEVAPVVPGPYVWERIRAILKMEASTQSKSSRGPWNTLRFWQWLGIGASAFAAACLVVVFTELRNASIPVENSGYVVASITQDGGGAGWTATVDIDRARLVVVPASPPTIAQDRDTELWLIPDGQKPISIGVIARDKPSSIALSPLLVSRLGPAALLAVSIEPRGGSPTGQPTGPVIAKGAISKT